MRIRILACLLAALFGCAKSAYGVGAYIPNAGADSGGGGGVVLPDGGVGALWYEGDSGTGIAALAAGASGQILTIGSNGLPSYANVSAGLVGTVTQPPLAASWTHVNFGGGTAVIDSGNGFLPTVYLSDFTTGTTGQIHGLKLARPGSVGTAYTVTAAFLPTVDQKNNSECGIFVTDGTKFVTMTYGFNNGGNIEEVKPFATAGSTPGTNIASATWNLAQNAFTWFRIQSDTTHRMYSYSVDGFNFHPTTVTCANTGTAGFPGGCQETISTSSINNTETAAGIYVDPENSAGCGMTLASWTFTSP